MKDFDIKIAGGPYLSVLEMIAEKGPPKFVHDFLKSQANRYIANELSHERVVRGITYKDMADRLGWSVQKLEVFEDTVNDELKPKDIAAYLKAVFAKQNAK